MPFYFCEEEKNQNNATERVAKMVCNKDLDEITEWQ